MTIKGIPSMSLHGQDTRVALALLPHLCLDIPGLSIEENLIASDVAAATGCSSSRGPVVYLAIVARIRSVA